MSSQRFQAVERCVHDLLDGDLELAHNVAEIAMRQNLMMIMERTGLPMLDAWARGWLKATDRSKEAVLRVFDTNELPLSLRQLCKAALSYAQGYETEFVGDYENCLIALGVFAGRWAGEKAGCEQGLDENAYFDEIKGHLETLLGLL